MLTLNLANSPQILYFYVSIYFLQYNNVKSVKRKIDFIMCFELTIPLIFFRTVL